MITCRIITKTKVTEQGRITSKESCPIFICSKNISNHLWLFFFVAL